MLVSAWLTAPVLAQQQASPADPPVAEASSEHSPWMPDSQRLAVLTGARPLEQRALAPGAAPSWDILLAPYFLGMSIDGTLQVGGLTEDLQLPPDFFFDNFDTGVSVYIEAKRFGRYGGAFDVSYVKVNNSFLTEDRNQVDWEFKLVQWELFGLYRFVNNPKRSIDALGGVRHKYIDLAVEVTGSDPGEGGFSENWFDPIVGARWIEDISRGFILIVRGDAGGFGVGSEMTWQVAGGLGVLAGGFAILLEYHYMDVKYEQGTGEDLFVYDVIEKGIRVGFGFAF
jgi:hypothetical protein